MSSLTRLRSLSAAALCLVAASAPAASAQSPVPIRPNMYFIAKVHGLTGQGVVDVACTLNIGHPLHTQSIEVDNVPGFPAGYTGSAANSIDAIFPTPFPSQVNPPVVLTSFNTRVAIPSSLIVPCGGVDSVRFTPSPTSPTASSISVAVTFVVILGS